MAPTIHADQRRTERPALAVATRRDRQAFAVLFKHFAPRIKGYLLRAGSAESAAEELAQETMVSVWRKAASFDPARAQLSTWIFTIARNLRVDRHRRDGSVTEHETALDDEHEQIAGTAASVEDQLSAARRERCVRLALAQLPADRRCCCGCPSTMIGRMRRSPANWIFRWAPSSRGCGVPSSSCAACWAASKHHDPPPPRRRVLMALPLARWKAGRRWCWPRMSRTAHAARRVSATTKRSAACCRKQRASTAGTAGAGRHAGPPGCAASHGGPPPARRQRAADPRPPAGRDTGRAACRAAPARRGAGWAGMRWCRVTLPHDPLANVFMLRIGPARACRCTPTATAS